MTNKSHTVKVCEEIMQTIAQTGFTNQISRKELEKIITIKRGGDPRTLRNWIKNLVLLEYLERQSNVIFKVNLTRCPEALRMVIKQGQKKLL